MSKLNLFNDLLHQLESKELLVLQHETSPRLPRLGGQVRLLHVNPVGMVHVVATDFNPWAF